MIHVEFAHFSNLDIFRIFEKYAVTHADSLGMNEQELILLLDFWEGKLDVSVLYDTKKSFLGHSECQRFPANLK